jgi:hypothetical protein
VHEGEIAMRCNDDTQELSVHSIAALAIDADPRIAVDAVEHARARAYDAGGRELELGDAPVDWRILGMLERRTRSCPPRDSCMDFCVELPRPPSTELFAGTQRGAGLLIARFGTHTAHRAITID